MDFAMRVDVGFAQPVQPANRVALAERPDAEQRHLEFGQRINRGQQAAGDGIRQAGRAQHIGKRRCDSGHR
ncbi:MAG: hypothetical protein HND48_24130 [Chloroflexi bacterium]|nr:hypothetical protein [Chloroflexota bacterium]